MPNRVSHPQRCIRLFQLLPTSPLHRWLIAADWLEDNRAEVAAAAFRERLWSPELKDGNGYGEGHGEGGYGDGGYGDGIETYGGYSGGDGNGNGNGFGDGNGYGFGDGSGNGDGGGDP